MIAVIFSSGIAVMKAQDIHFSQFTLAPLFQNPAFAGAGHDQQVILNYKDQWRSVANPFKTFDATFDMKFSKGKPKSGYWAGGLIFFTDRAGDAKMGTTQGNLMAAYHVILDAKSTLGMGISGGVAQRSVKYDDLRWANQFDGMNYQSTLPSFEPEAANSLVYPDLGAGLLYNYKKSEGYITGNDNFKLTLGASLAHPLQPKYSFYGSDEKLYMKMIVHGYSLIGLKNTPLSLEPAFMYYRQGPAQEIYFGTMVKYMLKEESKYTGYVKGSAISFGLYYRNADALVPAFMIEMGQYSFGMSYDVNVSKLKTASFGRGGFEFAFRFVNPNPFIFKSSSSF